MQDLLGLHLAAVILTTQLVALFVDPRLGVTTAKHLITYFPIEISRTAASLPFAANVFKLGVLSLGAQIPFASSKDAFIPIWIGLLMIAFFDDVTYWGVHMFGVLLMFLGFLPLLLLGGPDKTILFVSAISIYLLRIGLKTMVIVLIELDLPINQVVASRTAIFTKSLDVMQHGSLNPDVVDVFRVCGVVQWCAFYLLYRML
jgi:hypothetical protein